jgi:hypothetical protein
VVSLVANLRARRSQLRVDEVDLTRIETDLAVFTRDWARIPEAGRGIVVQEFTDSRSRPIRSARSARGSPQSRRRLGATAWRRRSRLRQQPET